MPNYEHETVQDMEKAWYRMHLYWYKQKIWQCKILLGPTSSKPDLKVVPPSLNSSLMYVASPTQHLDQISSHDTGELGQPSTA